MRLLFLCTSNRLRSPTAEGVFRTWPGMSVASAGLDPSATRHVDVSMIEAADMIFVMEARHRTLLQRRFKSALGDRPVIVLGIPDEYERDDPALIDLLRERVTPFLPGAGPDLLACLLFLLGLRPSPSLPFLFRFSREAAALLAASAA